MKSYRDKYMGQKPVIDWPRILSSTSAMGLAVLIAYIIYKSYNG